MISLQHKEKWKILHEFPNYEISNLGRIYNSREDIMMRTSQTGHGNIKITLVAEQGIRYTRSVAQLVAEAFVDPPNALCNTVVVLDGDLSNVTAENLIWRPAWFAWKYIRQLRVEQPHYYHNLRVMNLITGVEYSNIIEAGMTEGLLFADIWRSTYTGAEIFPGDLTFEVIGENVLESTRSHAKHGL